MPISNWFHKVFKRCRGATTLDYQSSLRKETLSKTKRDRELPIYPRVERRKNWFRKTFMARKTFREVVEFSLRSIPILRSWKNKISEGKREVKVLHTVVGLLR